MRVLLLGGTTEATALAARLKVSGIDTVLSYAGRTKTPARQPVETRIGGFGGPAGMLEYLRSGSFSHVIDATHPFAAQMSRNAYTACTAFGTPLIRLERPAWQPQSGDDWIYAATLEDAAAALPNDPARVFLAIGRQHVGVFATRPEHFYLLRFVDPPKGHPLLPKTDTVIARGPFDAESDAALLRQHRISHVVTKNAGGTGAEAKLLAARQLGLRVIMVARPSLPDTTIAPDIETIFHWLTPRGV